ncbi:MULTISPECIES: hypothetical protein [unclassified Phenylobacterium]|uniref:hypothetical protein n=1 Tax=unclassified Phenylobacterium TaxID=2640670 RepID=UPI00083A095C|nr:MULTISPECIES: hypothetical protein [unclassified Phenylobacterium]
MRFATIAMAAGVAGVATLAIAAVPASPLGPPPASGAGLPEGQCMILRDVGNHSVVDKNTLLVEAVGKNRGLYRFTMTNGCLKSAISSDPIGMSQVSHGGVICKPRDVTLHARSGLCAVDSIARLTPDEAAALPRKLKP